MFPISLTGLFDEEWIWDPMHESGIYHWAMLTLPQSIDRDMKRCTKAGAYGQLYCCQLTGPSLPNLHQYYWIKVRQAGKSVTHQHHLSTMHDDSLGTWRTWFPLPVIDCINSLQSMAGRRCFSWNVKNCVSLEIKMGSSATRQWKTQIMTPIFISSLVDLGQEDKNSQPWSSVGGLGRKLKYKYHEILPCKRGFKQSHKKETTNITPTPHKSQMASTQVTSHYCTVLAKNLGGKGRVQRLRRTFDMRQNKYNWLL